MAEEESVKTAPEVKESAAAAVEDTKVAAPDKTTYNFMGQEIAKGTADELMQRGYDAFLAEEEAKNNPKQTSSAEQALPAEEITLKTQQKQLKEVQDELRSTRLDIENQRTYNTMLQQMAVLVKDNEFLQSNPEEVADIQQQVLLNLHANPKQTIQTAFNAVVKKEQAKSQRAITAYTKGKIIDAEKTTTERGSGAAQIENREPMTADQIRKGAAKKLLFESMGLS